MTLQLGMSRFDRDPADVLTVWALKEYERLQLESNPKMMLSSRKFFFC